MYVKLMSLRKNDGIEKNRDLFVAAKLEKKQVPSPYPSDSLHNFHMFSYVTLLFFIG